MTTRAEEIAGELSIPKRPVKIWYVTGAFHGSHVYSRCEGDARRTFHEHYNGESIVHITDKRYFPTDEDETL
jgi:hypothetical protein